jgi:hypothetical protein
MGAIHLSHAARTDGLADLVVTEHLADHSTTPERGETTARSLLISA